MQHIYYYTTPFEYLIKNKNEHQLWSWFEQLLKIKLPQHILYEKKKKKNKTVKKSFYMIYNATATT